MDNLTNFYMYIDRATEQATEVYVHLGGGIFEHIKSRVTNVKLKDFRFVTHQNIVGELQIAKREDKILVLKEERKDILLINFDIVR